MIWLFFFPTIGSLCQFCSFLLVLYRQVYDACMDSLVHHAF
uniref:Uncharacterized protein n=1 Tax=Rhizophora mucronata TaxID=61149 RepID=A0A2P2R3L4_RHIMU